MMVRTSPVFWSVLLCCLALAPKPAPAASVQASEGSIPGIRLPDGRASDAFDGSNGGTFGAKTVTNLTKSNKVVVAGFNVTYRFYNEAVARVRASYLPGRDTSGASSKIEMNLSGVDDATLQAITDRAYAVFVEQLRLAGREVVPLEQVQPYWPEFSRVKKPSDRKGTYKMFAPSGWPLVTDAVLESGVSQAANNEGWLPTDRQTLQMEGYPNAYVMGDTVDLPVSKAGGSCHNQCPVIVNNIAGDIRIGRTVDAYDGKVQAVAQMGLEVGMPLWYDYDEDVHPTPPTKVGGLLRKAFNRGIYWSVARGIV